MTEQLADRIRRDLETWPTRAHVQMLFLGVGFAALGFLIGVQFLAIIVDAEFHTGMWAQNPDATAAVGTYYERALLGGLVAGVVGLAGGVLLDEDGGVDG